MSSIRRTAVVGTVALVIFSAAVLTLGNIKAQGPPSAADKVYDDGQARRGLALYEDKCASCHDGGTMGPELWGATFLVQWRSKDVAALYATIAETMPQDAPGSLSEVETLATIAHILKENGYAAGEKPLQGRQQLVGMKFVDPK